MRSIVEALAQAETRQQVLRTLHAFVLAQAGVDRRHLHVLASGLAVDQVIALKHKAKGFAAQPGERVRIELGDIHPLKLVAAAAGSIEAAQNVHQRRFARTRTSHHGDKLTGVDIEVDAAQHRDLGLAAFAASVVLADAAQANQRGFGVQGRRHHCSHRSPASLVDSPITTRSPSRKPSNTCA